MEFRYFNQYWYNAPYPASGGYENKTVATSGCGPTSAAMIVSTLTQFQCDPVTMANYAMEVGARVPGGTDMHTLAKAVCKRFGLGYRHTRDESDLIPHLQGGGMAICLAGVRKIFSDGGHYIVAAKCEGTYIGNMDSANYAGKYDKPGRRDVKVEGNFCYCDLSVLASDCSDYWLFSKPADTQFDNALAKLVSCKIVGSPDYWKNSVAGDTPVKGEWLAAVLQGATGTSNLADAVAKLQSVGAIGQPDYWLQNCVPGGLIQASTVRTIIVNIAEKLL